jgi:competence protein ComEA
MLKKILVLVAMLYAAVCFAAVDVNKANAAELDSIKGIGPAISGKILDERKKGNFKDWNDFIVRVKGVGENNAAKFSTEGLTVDGTAYKGAPAAPAAKKEVKVDAKAAAVTAPASAAAVTKADAKAEAKAKKEAEKKAKADEKLKKADEAKAKKEADLKAKDEAKKAKDTKPAAKGAKAEAAKPAASAASAAKK